MPKLANDRHERFAQEMCVDLSKTKAAIRAGFAPKSARVQGQQLMKRPEVQARVAELEKDRLMKTGLTAERVLQEIATIALGDVRGIFSAAGELLPPNQWPDDVAKAVAGLDVVTVNRGEGVVEHVAKIKSIDRLKALDMLARHHAIYNDSMNVNINEGLAERVKRAGERAGLDEDE